jgi:hypothetical protein
MPPENIFVPFGAIAGVLDRNIQVRFGCCESAFLAELNDDVRHIINVFKKRAKIESIKRITRFVKC